MGSEAALKSRPHPEPQHRQQAEAAHQQEDVQRHPQAVIAEGGAKREHAALKARKDNSIMLRMSRDQVAPMKTPSIWKASTPLSAVNAAQGR